MIKNLSIIKIEGKGLSFEDAVTLTDYGDITLATIDCSRYKEGTLMMRLVRGKVVPFIKFSENARIHLCVAFQTKGVDGEYGDINLAALISAQSYSMRTEEENHNE